MIEKFMNNVDEKKDVIEMSGRKKAGMVFMSLFLVGIIFAAAGCTGGNSAPPTPPPAAPAPAPAPAPEADTGAAPAPAADSDIANVAPDVVNTDDVMVEPGAADNQGQDKKKKKKKDKKSEDDKEGDEIDIIANNGEKMVTLVVEQSGRPDPFLPANEKVEEKDDQAQKLLELQKAKLQYDLVEPPNAASADGDASRVLTTTVSGIMYDKTSPSAILNIEGSDFLVRSGDVINGYKVLAISPTVVTVQLGANVYQAGVGQLLATDGINYNTVSNLSKKFGGAKK